MYIRKESEGRVTYELLKCPRCDSKVVGPAGTNPNSKRERYICKKCMGIFTSSKYPNARLPDEMIDMIGSMLKDRANHAYIQSEVTKKFGRTINTMTITSLNKRFHFYDKVAKKNVEKRKCNHKDMRTLTLISKAKNKTYGNTVGRFECRRCKEWVYRSL